MRSHGADTKAGAQGLTGRRDVHQQRNKMEMTKIKLKATLDAHALWLKTRDADNVQGERADLTGKEAI